jgi:hypothetical protein
MRRNTVQAAGYSQHGAHRPLPAAVRIKANEAAGIKRDSKPIPHQRSIKHVSRGMKCLLPLLLTSSSQLSNKQPLAAGENCMSGNMPPLTAPLMATHRKAN